MNQRVSLPLSLNEGMGSFIHERHRKAAALFRYHVKAREKFLDVGCGFGVATLFFAEAVGFQRPYGVDIDINAVSATCEKGIAASVCDLDEEKLPFADDVFDAVFAGDVIEHVRRPDQLLREVRRVLTIDGVFVVTTPNLASWSNRIMLLFGWQPYESGTSFEREVGRPVLFRLGPGGGMGSHLHLYTLRALQELLVFHGFQCIGLAQAAAREREREKEREGISRWRPHHKLAFGVDRAMTVVPGLGHRLIVAARRRS